MPDFHGKFLAMIPRPIALDRIDDQFVIHPVVAVLGPRQCGKTTLARAYAEGRRATFFDLDNPVDRQRIGAPLTALEGLADLVVIDEFQRRPELLEIIRVLVDRPTNPARFLILGSASPTIVRGSSESLAGRIGFVDLGGFSLEETGAENRDSWWNRGGFPRSLLAATDEASFAWRQSFIRTLLERDIPQLGITIPAETMRRFWTMIAHNHANLWNAALVARSLGISEKTGRRYLDILTGAFMLRLLPPWFENLKKRQVKAPKTYIRDSGIVHALLQLPALDAVRGHPKLGASWEGLALEHVMITLDAREAYFWATHNGAELDLLLPFRGRRLGFEFKYSDAPTSTRSMRIALEDLHLDHLWIIYPGQVAYQLDKRISVIPLAETEHAVTGHLVSGA